MARALVASTALLVLIVEASFSGAGSPTPVRATRANERFPAADVGYLAWSEVVGRKQHVFAKLDGEAPFRVSTWANGATGGIDGSTLV